MKIIEWNCQGAFRKKHDRILSFHPDILIIPECESEVKLRFGELTPKPTDFFWYGDNENKGIGIFSYTDFKFELLQSFNPSFRYIIPLKVTGRNTSFILFAIWAMDNKEKPEARYIGQIWLAINYYSKLFTLPCILAGDFNSNKIWDRKERVGNHSDVVEFLEKKNIYSLYHNQEKLEHGKEKHPTFYMYRKKEKPYHIDYFFASRSFIESRFNISVDNSDNWIDYSDHIPLILEINTQTTLDNFEDSFFDFLKEKIDCLSPDIQTKCHDIIDEILINAKKINYSKENIKKRTHLIRMYEKLSEIDRLAQELKNSI